MAKKKPYRYFVYLLARTLAAVVLIFPKQWIYPVTAFFSKIAFRLVSRQSEKTVKHLRMVYQGELSDAQIEERAIGVMRNMALTGAEFLRFAKTSHKEWVSSADADAACGVYDELLKEGKGLISLTAHIGNWEMLAGVFASKGYRGAVLGRRLYYEPYNRWIVGLRSNVGVRTIYRDQSTREILSLLKDNQIVGLLPDQDIDSLKGIFVNFFGKPAYTTIAPARLSLTSGAPIVTNFLVRVPDGKYRIILDSVIRPQYDRNREQAVREMTEKWMRSFESVIRKYPEQWAWMHNRWKTQPESGDAYDSGHFSHEEVNRVSA